jgi:hypothetical protein
MSAPRTLPRRAQLRASTATATALATGSAGLAAAGCGPLPGTSGDKAVRAEVQYDTGFFQNISAQIQAILDKPSTGGTGGR